MNTLTFLNSPLLWGLAAASIPIIIHLLFRRRYRRVEWAPMKYLKLTIQRNRRRIQIEQLLLLLLRVAMIVVLFLFLARPAMHAAGLGSWLGGRSRTSQILLLDDSLSMGLAVKGKSALARAKEVAKSLVEDVSAKDRFTLVLASQPKAPLLAEVEVTDSSRVTKLIDDAPPSDAFVSWKTTLEALDKRIADSTFPMRELTIITDLRRAGWDQELTELASRWAAERVRMRIFDVGAVAGANLTLASLEQTDRLALAGAAVHWEAVIRNNSDDVARNVEATLLIDRKPNVIKLPEIAAGREIRVPLSATFQEAGLHEVSFRLPADELPGDNQRWNVLRVQENLHIVLVDGEPSGEPLAGEVDFLALSLSLGVGEADAFQVDVITDADLPALANTQPDLLVLANLATLSPDQADVIERLVRTGMGLVVFVGEQLDPDTYNRLLFKDGKGILPAELESINDEPANGLVLEPITGPSPLAAMGQLSAAVLERIQIKRSYQLKMPTKDDAVRVLARWNNPAASPAAVEKIFGQGRTLLWTIAADKQWSEWPTDPSYPYAMRESAKMVARSDASARSLTAGELLRRAVPVDREISKPTATIPHSQEPVAVQVDTEPGPAGAKLPKSKSLLLADTRRAGVYALNWVDSKSGPTSDSLAVNPDVRESDLDRIQTEQLKGLWGTFDVNIVSAADGADVALATREQEIWRTLATMLLGMTLIEAGFATWTGRQR